MLDSGMKKNYYHQKTILITGAASGIGKRFAERVSETTENTLILWDRNPELLKESVNFLSDKTKYITKGVDISDVKQIEMEAENLIRDHIIPDIIINCAGIVVGKMFHDHTPEDIEQTLRINTGGSMFVVYAFIDAMMKRGSGHIVNLASASGYIGNPRMSVYAASKWAIIGWSESLRLEMNKLESGIKVTTVIPGYIDTGMFEGVKAPVFTPILKTDEIVDRMLRGIAAGRSEIRAPFIVHSVPFLKAVLPPSVFDWLAGNVLGVYSSMDTFTGRNKLNKS